MSRRVYYWNPKRKQIHQEALLNLRAARGNIDPDLLESARKAIAAGIEKGRGASTEKPAERQQPGPDMVAVDREKNLLTILSFLELKRDNHHLLSQVKGLMTEL